MRDDVLLSRLTTQARPPLAGWPLGSRAARARLVVFDTRRHVIEFPTEPPGRLEITENGSPTEHHTAARQAYVQATLLLQNVPKALKVICAVSLNRIKEMQFIAIVASGVVLDVQYLNGSVKPIPVTQHDNLASGG